MKRSKSFWVFLLALGPLCFFYTEVVKTIARILFSLIRDQSCRSMHIGEQEAMLQRIPSPVMPPGWPSGRTGLIWTL